MPLAWLGRINTLKMTILHKVLYHFYALPIGLSEAFFRELKTAFLKFIWGNSLPLLSYKTLSAVVRQGLGVAGC